MVILVEHTFGCLVFKQCTYALDALVKKTI